MGVSTEKDGDGIPTIILNFYLERLVEAFSAVTVEADQSGTAPEKVAPDAAEALSVPGPEATVRQLTKNGKPTRLQIISNGLDMMKANKTGTTTIVMIPLTQINPPTEQFREFRSEESDQELVNSIRAQGILQGSVHFFL